VSEDKFVPCRNAPLCKVKILRSHIALNGALCSRCRTERAQSTRTPVLEQRP
jgi:hypothetical protein